MATSPEKRIAELEKELLLVDSGEHPMLQQELHEIEQKQANELEMINIMYEREKAAIETKFQRECAAIKRELKKREDELVQAMLTEIDDRIQSIKDEMDALDIDGPAHPLSSMNRKERHFRKRRYDPPTSAAKKRCTKKPAIIPLLPEHVIAEDLKLFAPDESVTSAREHHNVALKNRKLIYDGKHYKRGEAVVVQTENSATFPGKILTIHERCIQIISTVPGVTREVLATMGDLRSGLVILRKQSS